MSEVSSYRFIAGAITGPVVLYSLSKLEILRRLIKTDYIPGAPTRILYQSNHDCKPNPYPFVTVGVAQSQMISNNDPKGS